jgi:preprotein translocase subunit SecA
MAKGESIEHKWLSRSIESAQRKVEGHNFDIRKQLLDYDDVSNEQRRVIYQQRDEILVGKDLTEVSSGMIKGVLDNLFDTYIPPKSMIESWDIEGLEAILKNEYLIDYNINNKLETNSRVSDVEIKAEIIDQAMSGYKTKMSHFTAQIKNEMQNFAGSIIGDDKAAWDISQLDDFCLQNDIFLEKSFETYVNENPDITRQELLSHFDQYAIEPGIAHQITRFERGVLLQHIDYYWREHLTQLEQLRQGIHLRGYAQKDPKQEYKQEAFNLFSGMLDNIKRNAAKVLLTARLQGISDIMHEDIGASSAPQMVHHNAPNILQPQVVEDGERPISRNAPCPCGSGKKYKHCHGKLV